MSIWIKNKKGESVLAPHSYERSIVSYSVSSKEKLVLWLEGVNTKFSFHKKHLKNEHYIPNSFFSICGGGPINTNSGIKLNKEQLQEIVDSMKEGSTLNIASCASLKIEKDNSEYFKTKSLKQEFKCSNDMIQTGPNAFAPSKTVEIFLKTNLNQIHPDYLEYCRLKILEKNNNV